MTEWVAIPCRSPHGHLWDYSMSDVPCILCRVKAYSPGVVRGMRRVYKDQAVAEAPIDLSAEALADVVDRERYAPDPTIVELTRALLDLTEREKRARLALIAIREVRGQSSDRPYTALSVIDELAWKGLL